MALEQTLGNGDIIEKTPVTMNYPSNGIEEAEDALKFCGNNSPELKHKSSNGQSRNLYYSLIIFNCRSSYQRLIFWMVSTYLSNYSAIGSEQLTKQRVANANSSSFLELHKEFRSGRSAKSTQRPTLRFVQF
jgi:hypothetical protein